MKNQLYHRNTDEVISLNKHIVEAKFIFFWCCIGDKDEYSILHPYRTVICAAPLVNEWGTTPNMYSDP